MLTVLITTSGTGSRLSYLTKHTNKSLISIGDKFAICYIIELYPEDTEYIITIGYKGELVKEFLTMAYPKLNFIFIEVDLYEGIGSSLGYSMLQARKYIKKPFIFNCCDTILLTPFTIPTENTMFVSKYNSPLQYSSVLINGNNIENIYEKETLLPYDYIYTGLAYIKNYDAFWKILETLYTSSPNFTGLSDIHVFQQILKIDKIQYKEITDYNDTGNLEVLQKTITKFNKNFDVLEKNYESICFFSNRVIKFINDPSINAKRIIRGKSLYPMTPEIIDYNKHFISMKFIKGDILSEVTDYGEILKLLNWAITNLWTNKTQNDSFKDSCILFYKNKTIQRINNINLSNEHITVNGITTGKINTLLDTFDFNLLVTDIFYKFHGDFILDNIIRNDTGQYTLLDWRHEFSDQLYLGDMYYDLAKLNHNIIFNHKNIKNKLFTYKETESEVVVDLKCNYLLIRQLSDFNTFVKANNLDSFKIKIITSLIWLNMAPLYEDPLRSFLFYFGKFTLYIALQERL